MQVMTKIATTDNANQTETQAQMLKKQFNFAFVNSTKYIYF